METEQVSHSSSWPDGTQCSRQRTSAGAQLLWEQALLLKDVGFCAAPGWCRVLARGVPVVVSIPVAQTDGLLRTGEGGG